MIRILTLCIILSSCGLNSGGQKAVHLDNKGITCDGKWNEMDHLILCGETMTYADHSQGGQQKDAFIVDADHAMKDFKAYSIGDGHSNFRFEKVVIGQDRYIFSGFGFEDKSAMVASFSKKMELQWAMKADSVQAFEEPAFCSDSKGNCLLVSKNTSADPYYGFFTLLKKDGTKLWSAIIDQIDVMADIASLRNGDFLVCFTQKGAYIDGGTRKKYFIVPIIRLNINKEISYQVKFLIDREKFMGVEFTKVLETASGNLYFCGKAWSVENRSDMFVIKTDAGGKVIWANTYRTNKELMIKSAVLDDKEQVIIAADSYGHNGGFLRAAINLNGDMIWNSYDVSTPYEQVKSIHTSKNGLEFVIDKTLNFGMMTSDLKGKTCLGSGSELPISKIKTEVILSNHNAELLPNNTPWHECKLNVQTLKNVKSMIDCGK